MNILQSYHIIEIIGFGLVIAMIINAINVCFWEGHIFQKIGDWFEVHYPTLWKPVAGCIICMTPWWGGVMCWVFGWPFLAVLVAMGINVIIVKWTLDND